LQVPGAERRQIAAADQVVANGPFPLVCPTIHSFLSSFAISKNFGTDLYIVHNDCKKNFPVGGAPMSGCDLRYVHEIYKSILQSSREAVVSSV
jgi:hypothetical protein